MTRITNVGRKRTHVEATFNYSKGASEDPDTEPTLGETAGEPATVVANTEGMETTKDSRGADGQPPKKKRKRGPRKKAGAKVAAGSADGGEGEEKGEVDGEETGKKPHEASKKKGGKNKGKFRTLQGSVPLATPTCSKFTRTLQSAKRLRKNDAAGE